MSEESALADAKKCIDLSDGSLMATADPSSGYVASARDVILSP